MMLLYPHENPASEVTEVWLITEADLPLRKELSILNLSNWPGQSLQLIGDTEALRKTQHWTSAILWRPCPAPKHPAWEERGPFRPWGTSNRLRGGGGYLGKWAPEVFLAPPLRNGHISTPLRSQALLTLVPSAASHHQVLWAVVLLQVDRQGPRSINAQKQPQAE